MSIACSTLLDILLQVHIVFVVGLAMKALARKWYMGNEPIKAVELVRGKPLNIIHETLFRCKIAEAEFADI